MHSLTSGIRSSNRVNEKYKKIIKYIKFCCYGGCKMHFSIKVIRIEWKLKQSYFSNK